MATLENCCGGGGGGGVDSNCCGPFSLGTPGSGWSSCCDNVCPPPVCCCGSVTFNYQCGGGGTGASDCYPVNPCDLCPPPCEGSPPSCTPPSYDPPDCIPSCCPPSYDPPSYDPPSYDPPSYEDPPITSSVALRFRSILPEGHPDYSNNRSNLSYALEDFPGIEDFTNSYIGMENNPNYTKFARESGSHLPSREYISSEDSFESLGAIQSLEVTPSPSVIDPSCCCDPCTCATTSVTVTFSGCCLYIDGCSITTVGSGDLTWNSAFTAGSCSGTVSVNGDSSGSLSVADGESVSVSISGVSGDCCNCELVSQTGCGIAFDNSNLYSLVNGKLALNKKEYMKQRNALIKHRAETKLRKLSKERKNSLLNKIRRRN
jgi:hypothetical protein